MQFEYKDIPIKLAPLDAVEAAIAQTVKEHQADGWVWYNAIYDRKGERFSAVVTMQRAA